MFGIRIEFRRSDKHVHPDRPITVQIKRLRAGVNLPMRMTAQAAGFDLSAAVDHPIHLDPGEIKLIPCGFAMAIPPGYEGQIRARSGLASKHGVTMVNGIGTIDSDYRGEVHLPLINHGKNSFTIDPSMRIAQMLILPVPAVEIKEVTELEETARGMGGFGHTGA